MRKSVCIFFVAILPCLSYAPITFGQNAKLHNLGAFPGGGWSSGRGINDFGIVVAEGGTPDGKRPLMVPLYGPNGGEWKSLGTLGGEMDAGANAVANSGLVVGYAGTADGYVRAFAWTEMSGMSDLGLLAEQGHLYSQATNVNSLGTLIVGWSSIGYDSDGDGWNFDTPNYSAVVWTPYLGWQNGKLVTKWQIHALDQTGMEQYYGWYPGSVNNTGQISGHAWSDEGLSAVVWNPLPDGKGWKVQKLECPADYPFCSASGINDKGEIVGFGVSPDWSSHIAVMWKPLSNDSRTWAITELASLPANPSYIGANSLNNLGEIIGSGADQNGNWVATRWNDRDPGTVKLLGFPSAPGLANRVNNFGVAIGTYSSTTCGWCAAAIEIPKGRK